MRTLKAIAALLSYPTESLVKVAPEIPEMLKSEGLISPDNIKKIEALATELTSKDILEMQEEYVNLFDRTPSLSLHMFEHIHGDSRERGQAMVDLSQMYKEEGLEMTGNETPDYLPMFLEYLSCLDGVEALKCLNETVNVLGAIAARLENRKTAYASIFTSLVSLAKDMPSKEEIDRAMAEDDGSEMSIEDMDQAWEEQFAFDNANVENHADGSSCGGCSSFTGSKEDYIPQTGDESVKVVIKENM